MADSAAAESPLEPLPDSAGVVFGERLPLAERFAGLLADEGVVRGLIGPGEPSRIWTRHLLNCAAITELFEPDTRVVDVGSGAGLPGLVIAVRRPDLHVDLVEPLQRRAEFLTEATTALGLDQQVRVIRGRAEDPAVVAAVGDAPWVTARAVAPLDRLVRWCLPLLGSAGRLALMKGASAGGELDRHRAALTRAGAADPTIVQVGAEMLDPAVTVVTLRRSARRTRRSAAAPSRHTGTPSTRKGKR